METIRFSTPQDQTIPGTLQNLEMFASFQNVLFTFDNSSDNDLAVYEYELYEEDDIVDPNTPELYILKPNPLIAGEYVPPFKSGAGNSSVFAVPVEGSYIDVENNNIVVQKNFFGRVRARDTSGNPGQWTDIKKTDQSTPLIDSQYIVSLTASKIKAGEIESAAITLGGANPLETIIRSKTYVTSSGQEGWYIDGAGEFSLGGPEGINYSGGSITIGSDVQVNANLAADSISVGSGLNQLNINDAINGGNGGMTLGQGLNNYWYSNGNFRVGNATSYVIWNGTSLQVKGTITADSGTFSGTINSGDLTATGGSIAGWTINASGFTKVSGPNTTRVFHNNTSSPDYSARFSAIVETGGNYYSTSLASLFVEATSTVSGVTNTSLVRSTGFDTYSITGGTTTSQSFLAPTGLNTPSIITPNNGGLGILTGRISAAQLTAENAIAKVGFFGGGGIGNIGVVFAFGLSILAGSSSTREVKRNIEDSTSDEVEELLMNLRPVKFQYKYAPNADELTRRMSDEQVVYGFIAEEVADVYKPLAVFMPRSEDWWNREEVTYETMVEDFKPSDWDQRAVTSLLVKGYQKVVERINNLESRLQALEIL